LLQPEFSLLNKRLFVPNIVNVLVFNHNICPLPEMRSLGLQGRGETFWSKATFWISKETENE
jgi:hypothetical protein